MNTPLISSFDEINNNQLSLLGGKGANLVILTRAGFPIPPGFCVTTQGYRLFMEQHPYAAEVFTLLSEINIHHLREVEKNGNKIRHLLEKGTVPDQIRDELNQAVQSFAAGTRFAVRSSATAEDLPDASFAGQQDTYLNISGIDRLIEHIKKCWISLFTDRAIVYRIQQGFDHRKVELSVIVQEMVNSEASGILFTANPITSNRAEIMVNAGFGLGEALVSGIITPDTYTIDKNNPEIITKEIGSKHAAIQYAASGGTEEISLPAEKQSAQVLNLIEIQRLAILGKSIETYYGSPQDIEWAKTGDKFYILQARPITTLFPIPVRDFPDGKEHIYASFGHLQMMTDTLSPMGVSLIRWIIPFGKNSKSTMFSPIVTQAGGRIYFDASDFIQNPIAYHNFHVVMGYVDVLMRSGMEKLVSLDHKPAIKDVLRMRFILRWVLPVMGGALLNLLFADPQKQVADIKQRMENWITAYEKHLQSTDDLKEKFMPLNGFRGTEFINLIIHFPPRIFPGILAQQLIPRLLPGEDITQEIQAIQRSIYDNITTEMDLQIGDLADLFKKDAQQREALLQMENEEAVQKILERLDTPPMKPSWDAFLEKFGHRGPGEIDIQQPRWCENQAGVATMIMGNLSNPEIGAHRMHILNIQLEGDQAAKKLLEFARSKPFGKFRTALIRRMVLWIRYGLGARENPKYYLIKLMGHVKETLKCQADQWVNEGVLQTQDDIFWLTLAEVLDAAQQTHPSIQGLVDEKKRKYSQYRKMVPPRIITSSGIIPSTDYNRDDIPDGALPGNPVSAGEVVGIARVILDPHKETIQAGEILIAPFTDPGWTPLFIHASGLVMELGGNMTHGSVVAREYGIPAVAGVINATQKIRSGMKIRVDGNQGFVEILDEEK